MCMAIPQGRCKMKEVGRVGGHTRAPLQARQGGAHAATCWGHRDGGGAGCHSRQRMPCTLRLCTKTDTPSSSPAVVTAIEGRVRVDDKQE